MQYLQILKINLASNELGKLHLDFPKLVFDKIRQILETQDVVLLDYNLNPDNADKSKPLSHAELIKMYLEGRYPEDDLPVIPQNLQVKSIGHGGIVPESDDCVTLYVVS